MKVVFLSVTGQTRKFVAKLNMPSMELSPLNASSSINEPFIMVVPSYEREATDMAFEFIEFGDNRNWLKGVVGGGNRNFAELFGFTAIDISRDYHVPLLHLFEFQGSDNDVTILKEKVDEIG